MEEAFVMACEREYSEDYFSFQHIFENPFNIFKSLFAFWWLAHC